MSLIKSEQENFKDKPCKICLNLKTLTYLSEYATINSICPSPSMSQTVAIFGFAGISCMKDGFIKMLPEWTGDDFASLTDTG